jgi:hypothetical protein
MLIAFFLVGIAPSFAATQDKFDLVCSGTEMDYKGVQSPWSWHFRFDLGVGSYCANDCKVISKLQAIEQGRIVIEDTKAGEGETRLMKIDRQSGTLFWQATSPTLGAFLTVKADCTPSSFSGFPSPKF